MSLVKQKLQPVTKSGIKWRFRPPDDCPRSRPGEVEAPIDTFRRLRGLNIPRLKSLTAIGVMQHKFIGVVDQPEITDVLSKL